MADTAYHYPTDLLNLLIDAIAILVRSKESVVEFFRSAGVPQETLNPWLTRIRRERDLVRKTDITRDILYRVNEQGDGALALRREIVKRIVEWEDYSSCYPDKQLVAQGLVANVRRLVNIKDSFTQINIIRERERSAQQDAHRAELLRKQQQDAEREEIKRGLYALFGNVNAPQRGKQLEAVLNRFFQFSGLLVKEAFTLAVPGVSGVAEQLDGAIQFQGEIYLVEMKWWAEPIGPGEVNSHLSRLMTRAEARGMFISASGFTAAAKESVRSFLAHRVCILTDLEEIVAALENNRSFGDIVGKKVEAAITERNPFFRSQ